MINKEGIEALKNSCSISAVVENHGIQLKRNGASGEKGLCPFHNEKTPSFNVNDSTGTYHCFGCGASGDVIAFVMEIEGLSFPEALESLADSTGFDLSPYADSKQNLEEGTSKKLLLEVMNETFLAYVAAYKKLPDNHPAKQVVVSRKIQGMEDFGWGDDSRLNHLIKKYGRNIFEELGFFSAKGNHLFSGRLIFPIKDIMGRCVGFSARVLDDGIPKYSNTGASPLYNKSKLLYGLDVAKKTRSKECYVLEGQIDVCSMRAVGADNSVASCGTAITQEHINILLRRFDKLIFFMDSDTAGIEATRKLLSLKGVALNSYAVINKFSDDANGILRKEGEQALIDVINDTKPLVDFVLSPFIPTSLESPTDGGIKEKKLIEIVDSIADDTVRYAWKKFVRSRFSEKISIEKNLTSQTQSSESSLSSLVSLMPEKVFRAVRNNSSLFEKEDIRRDSIINGILLDDDFVANIANYLEVTESLYAVNPLWNFLDTDKEICAVVLSLVKQE